MLRRAEKACKLLMSIAAFASICASADAQEARAGGAQELERVTVTGSNVLRSTLETASPVQVLTADDLARSGYTTLSQVLTGITANGQGTLSQSFPGAAAVGSSGIALRGLTVGATLVLIDGRRMAPFPIGDDAQRSFVDISNIPFDAVDRVEVLKDGASAIYGSDAIAGVVNIILKRSFVGTRISADAGSSYKLDGSTYHVAGMWGAGDLQSDGRNFYVAAEVRKQNRIRFADRGGLFTQTDFTSTGGFDVTRGVPNTLNGGLPESATGYVTDSSGNIIGFMPGCDAARFAAKQCTFANDWSLIQPATENYNLIGRFTQRLGADWQMSLQATYFESKSESVRRPQQAFSAGYQGVTSGPGVVPTLLPALPPTSISNTNPSFPVGTGATSGLLRYNFLDLGPNIVNTDSRSTRLIADLEGRVGDWSLAGAAGYTEVRLRRVGRNVVNPGNLQAALDSTTNPYLVGGPNSAAVLGSVAPELTSTSTSKLSFLHLSAERDLMRLGGGPLSVALGVDYVYRSQYFVAPDAVAAGLVDGFDNSFSVGAQRVGSVYGELVAPLSKELTLEAAVRYDRYNLSGGKTSPKLGAKYAPMEGLAVRGTIGRGFRAPGPAENGSAGGTFVAGTSSDPVLCKDPSDPGAVGNFPSQCVIQVAAVQGSNPALKPETSKSYTLGLILEPTKDVSASLDFYWIDIDNQIVVGNSQDAVRGTNFTPISQVQPDGSTSLVTPPLAPIAFYKISYINANRTRTNGVDLDLRFRHRFAGGVDYRSDFMVSFTNRYDLTVDGVTYHLAGTHGPLAVSGDTGNPKTRIRWTNTLSRGAWSVSGTVNYVGAFDLTDPSLGVDDCATGLTVGVGATPYASQLGSGTVPDGVKCKVNALTTLDLYGRYEVSKQFSLHASIVNVFNAGAPQDWGTYGGSGAPYNPAFHLQGAIGRYLTIGAKYQF